MSLRLAIYGEVNRSRAVTVNTDMTVTISDQPDPDLAERFTAQIYPARNPKGNPSDASPRSTAPRSLVWVDARRHPGSPFAAGDRIYPRGGGVELELVKGPIARRAGLATMAWEYEGINVQDLYPLLATLSDLGGVEVMDDLPMSLWQGTETARSRGMYDDLNAEAPSEFYNALKIDNRELVVGSKPFRIVSSLLHTASPHVKLQVRSADA